MNPFIEAAGTGRCLNDAESHSRILGAVNCRERLIEQRRDCTGPPPERHHVEPVNPGRASRRRSVLALDDTDDPLILSDRHDPVGPRDGRTGAPIPRAAVARLAGVSRSFTFENEAAHAIVTEAQARSRAGAEGRRVTMTAQQQASWRERALNAEDQIRALRRDLDAERRLVADLIGQLREPDGTWIEHDRNRLRAENQQLLAERNQLLRERDGLQRKLDGARANVAHIHQRRVTQLFPAGPGNRR